MRCISCGAEMRIARVEQDLAMKVAGYEYQRSDASRLSDDSPLAGTAHYGLSSIGGLLPQSTRLSSPVLCAFTPLSREIRRVARHAGAWAKRVRSTEPVRSRKEPTMHDDRDPFRAPRREPKPGIFHRPAHGFRMQRASEVEKLRLSGPITGKQKLGEGLTELPP